MSFPFYRIICLHLQRTQFAHLNYDGNYSYMLECNSLLYCCYGWLRKFLFFLFWWQYCNTEPTLITAKKICRPDMLTLLFVQQKVVLVLHTSALCDMFSCKSDIYSLKQSIWWKVWLAHFWNWLISVQLNLLY